jgi:hypothetical protein
MRWHGGGANARIEPMDPDTGRKDYHGGNAPTLDLDYAFCGRMRLQHTSASVNGIR